MRGAASSPLVSTSLTRPTMISWSPPSSWCSTVHSRVAITPSRRGLPVRPRRCRTPSQAAARPRRAKLVDRCCCRAPSTFTANAPCARTDSRVRLARSKQTRISGGSRDSELTALAVVPTGSPSGPTEVTTVTPVAKCPIACRKSAAETAGSGVVDTAAESVIVISYLPMVGWRDVAEQEVADVVVLPVGRVMAGVGAGVAPVPGQVMPLVGGAGAAQREQVAGHLDRDLAGERLGLSDRDRAAGRRLGVPWLAAHLLQDGRGLAK